jgi:hypothetical protein
MASLYQIRVQIIAMADDDGGNGANITANQVTSKLGVVNQVYASTQVEFVFDEVDDFLRLNSTLCNREFTILEPPNVQGDKWDHLPMTDAVAHGEARTSLAKQFPGKLVIIFRNRTEIVEEEGTGLWKIAPRGGGSAGNGLYVNMSTSSAANDLAHEMGHYLGLPHPFVKKIATVADARARIKNYVEVDKHPKAEGLNALDGDLGWVLDTPADARGSIFVSEGHDACADVSLPIEVTFSDNTKQTYTLDPDRSLVMSYFKGCPGPKTLSAQQSRRVRDGLELGVRHELISTKPSFAYSFVKGLSETGEKISQLDAVTVRAGRIATAVRDGSGNLKVVAWDIVDGHTVIRRGSATAGEVSAIAACSVGLNMVATAVRDGSGQLKVIVWRIADNGAVTRLGTVDTDVPISNVVATHVYFNYIATAAQRSDGILQVDMWQVVADGTINHVATTVTGKITLLGPVVGVGSSNLVTCVVNTNSILCPILWHFSPDNGKLVWWADSPLAGVPVGKLSGCTVSRETSVVAVQHSGSDLQLVGYRFPEDGTFLQRRGTAAATSGAVGDVDVCRLGTEMVVIGVRDGAGHLKLILEQVTHTADQFARLEAEATTEKFSHLSLCPTGRNEFATAIRDSDGNLKVISWTLSGTFNQPSEADTEATSVNVTIG